MKFYEKLDVKPVKEQNENDGKKWRATLNTGSITANGRRYNWSKIEIPKEGVPVLFNHGGGGLFGGSFEQELPIGHSDEITRKDKGIEGVFHFGEDPHSQIVAEKWEAGLFDGISVGVIPYTTTEVEPTGDVPGHIVIETGLLIEFSTVTIPADKDARKIGQEQLAAVLREYYGDNFDPAEMARVGGDVSKLLTKAEAIERQLARLVEYQETAEKRAEDQVWEQARAELKS